MESSGLVKWVWLLFVMGMAIPVPMLLKRDHTFKQQNPFTAIHHLAFGRLHTPTVAARCIRQTMRALIHLRVTNPISSIMPQRLKMYGLSRKLATSNLPTTMLYTSKNQTSIWLESMSMMLIVCLQPIRTHTRSKEWEMTAPNEYDAVCHACYWS